MEAFWKNLPNDLSERIYSICLRKTYFLTLNAIWQLIQISEYTHIYLNITRFSYNGEFWKRSNQSNKIDDLIVKKTLINVLKENNHVRIDISVNSGIILDIMCEKWAGLDMWSSAFILLSDRNLNESINLKQEVTDVLRDRMLQYKWSKQTTTLTLITNPSHIKKFKQLCSKFE